MRKLLIALSIITFLIGCEKGLMENNTNNNKSDVAQNDTLNKPKVEDWPEPEEKEGVAKEV